MLSLYRLLGGQLVGVLAENFSQTEGIAGFMKEQQMFIGTPPRFGWICREDAAVESRILTRLSQN